MASSLRPDPNNRSPIKSRSKRKPEDVEARLALADKKLKQAEMLLSVSRKVAAIEGLLFSRDKT